MEAAKKDESHDGTVKTQDQIKMDGKGTPLLVLLIDDPFGGTVGIIGPKPSAYIPSTNPVNSDPQDEAEMKKTEDAMKEGLAILDKKLAYMKRKRIIFSMLYAVSVMSILAYAVYAATVYGGVWDDRKIYELSWNNTLYKNKEKVENYLFFQGLVAKFILTGEICLVGFWIVCYGLYREAFQFVVAADPHHEMPPA